MNSAVYLEMLETESRHWWFSGRRAILSRIREGLDLPQQARALKVGCGAGGNLQMLARLYKVSALEMDANARATASKETNDFGELMMNFFNTVLSPLAVISRVMDKLLGSSSATETSIPPVPVNKFIKTIFGAERFLLERFTLPFGFSLLYVIEVDDDC